MNPLLSALTAAGIITADTADMVDRQMSPIDAQLYAERIMGDAFASGLKAQEIRYLDLVNAANGKPPEQQLAMFWQDENDALYRSVEGALVQVASDRAVQISVATGNADMWAVVNDEIVDWVGEYYQSFDPSFVGSIPNLNDTARTIVGQALNDWQRGELEAFGAADGLPQLIRALEPAFGVKRAQTIGVTETTRVFNEATIAAGRVNPLITRYRFFSAADDRVCPICGPLHNSISSANKDNPTWQHPQLGVLPIPPLHVNCRCQATPETDVTLQFDSDLPRPYTWSPETPAEYAKRRRDELAKTRPPTPKPPKAKAPEATLPPAPKPESPKPAQQKQQLSRPTTEAQTLARDRNIRDLRYEAKKYGVTEGVIETDVVAKMQQAIDENPVSIRARTNSAKKILEDGRFKTQFETNTSGGAFSPQARMQAETRGLNIPEDILPELRPVYGYVDALNGGLDASGYGNVQFVLKKDVTARSTFTLGDSLGGFARGDAVGLPSGELTAGTFVGSEKAMAVYKTGALEYEYLEAQIQGGVSVTDIERVIFHTKHYSVDEELVATLRRLNIPVEEIGTE